MPFFTVEEFNSNQDESAAESILWNAAGEFSHAAVRTKQAGKPGKPHSHDDEEQWTIVLLGRCIF